MNKLIKTADVITAKSAISTLTAKKTQTNLWTVWADPGTSASQHYTDVELTEKLEELSAKGWEINEQE